jgi:stage IV sporulation protein B
VVSVQKGGKGNPGELIAVFSEGKGKIGEVQSNSAVGLKGKMEKEGIGMISTSPIPVAKREEVTEGTAEIWANVEEEKVEHFSVEIQKINKDTESAKGMIIKITDERLLGKTGGIVQGMSGSPILQNGKLVGAITHVFVNDPTRGYGIFIENMLNAAEMPMAKAA